MPNCSRAEAIELEEDSIRKKRKQEDIEVMGWIDAIIIKKGYVIKCSSLFNCVSYQ